MPANSTITSPTIGLHNGLSALITDKLTETTKCKERSMERLRADSVVSVARALMGRIRDERIPTIALDKLKSWIIESVREAVDQPGAASVGAVGGIASALSKAYRQLVDPTIYK